MTEIRRREFIAGLGGTLFSARAGAEDAGCAEADLRIGSPHPKWTAGHFQIHSIYTGSGESQFLIFPDGTSMLIDCGDIGDGGIPLLPNATRRAGDWIARYVKRVNPRGAKVDYMLLSHYHDDHGGSTRAHAGKSPNGKYYLSGFAEAAEQLSFARAIDRAWPDYTDPVPIASGVCQDNMRPLYEELARRGTKIEKFELRKGSRQIAPQHGKAPDFACEPLCANGRFLLPDGTLVDPLKEYIAEDRPKTLNENGMSIGMNFRHGAFAYFTAGDIQLYVRPSKGGSINLEPLFGAALTPVDVAKMNHHGYDAMPREVTAKLRARVYLGHVWNQVQLKTGTMAIMADTTLYPGERLFVPCILPERRKREDAGKPWLGMVDPTCERGVHVVVDVPPGGRAYTVATVTAADESMRVLSAHAFKSRGKNQDLAI